MATIQVEGEPYRVVENMGYQHSAGAYAKVVHTPDGKRIAVKAWGGKMWRFWSAADRVSPLREAAARGWPHDKEGQSG